MSNVKSRFMTRRPGRPSRRGAALVECALVMPIMVLVVLGMFELGRAVMVTEVLAHTARTGARAGSITTGTTAGVRAVVNDVLADAGIDASACTVQVLVNGAATEVGSAKAGDEITVTVSVPYSAVTWVANPEYLDGRNLSGRCVMRRE
ncbi:MAG TPA: TadE/TadG family type IV pilus assembly protein [Planctomycetaceae bacterium]